MYGFIKPCVRYFNYVRYKVHRKSSPTALHGTAYVLLQLPAVLRTQHPAASTQHAEHTRHESYIILKPDSVAPWRQASA